MENASKALVIAGGIFLALLTISLLVILQSNLIKIKTSQDEKIAVQQLIEFNLEYEAFNKKYMYGTDVITLINKANENNLKYSDNNYLITINVFKSDETTKISLEEVKRKKTNIFACRNVDYNDIGRVSIITIIEKDEF